MKCDTFNTQYRQFQFLEIDYQKKKIFDNMGLAYPISKSDGLYVQAERDEIKILLNRYTGILTIKKELASNYECRLCI